MSSCEGIYFFLCAPTGGSGGSIDTEGDNTIPPSQVGNTENLLFLLLHTKVG